MKKALLMTAVGAEAIQAQQIARGTAIQRAAAELSAGIGRDAKVAIVSMEADSLGMSNYLIGEMIVAFSRIGVTLVDRSRLDLASQEMEAQFIVNGTFVSLVDSHRFRVLLIEAETGIIRRIHTSNIRHDNVISALLGGTGMRAPRAATASGWHDRVNWMSIEIVGLGGGLSYMRDINDWFSIGGTAWIDLNLILLHGGGFSVGATVTSRFFPGRFPFFLELGLGAAFAEWGTYDGDERDGSETFGIVIAPAIGVRLGGQTGGFFVSPSVGSSFVIGDGSAIIPRAGAGVGWAW